MSLQPCGLLPSLPSLPFVLYFADYDGYFMNSNCTCLLASCVCVYVCVQYCTSFSACTVP